MAMLGRETAENNGVFAQSQFCLACGIIKKLSWQDVNIQDVKISQKCNKKTNILTSEGANILNRHFSKEDKTDGFFFHVPFSHHHIIREMQIKVQSA